MKKKVIPSLILILVLVFTTFVSVAAAGPVNAAYYSHSGVIYVPVSEGDASAIATQIAAPYDNLFVQLGPGSYVVLKFPGDLAAVPDGSSDPDLRIDIIDTLYPASAEILLSRDGSNWTSKGVYPDTANIDLEVFGPVKYVKVNQGGYDIDPAYPDLGFDLDGVVALHSGPVNSPPIASAGGPYAGLLGAPIAIFGTASDPDGDPLTINWTEAYDHCALTNASILSPSITCTDVGTYTLTLSVLDGMATSVTSTTVTVSDPYFKTSVFDCLPGDYAGFTPVETLFVSGVWAGLYDEQNYPVPPVYTSTTLDPAYTYLVEASGVYYAGGNGTYDIRADAEWSQDAVQRASNLPWTDSVNNYEDYGEVLLELKVNGLNVEWGDYNTGHVYSKIQAGTGDPLALQFQIYDIYAPNNVGGLCVSLFKRDTTAPVIAPHADGTVEATSASGAIVNYSIPEATDAVDGPVGVTCTPATGTQFPLGDTTITCNATDSAGNAATPTTFVVHVVDTTAPVIAPHADVTEVATSTSGAIVTYEPPATSDAVDGAGVATCAPASGSQFALGDTTVTCNATDAAGNHATQTTFVVHVRYATGGMCYGGPGHAILQPINADGSSVFKQKSTVPAKFRVCASGNSIGTPGVVVSFRLVKITNGTVADVDEAVVSTTPDSDFRWSADGQQWIFNINTKNLSAGRTYFYRITLNDLSTIDFYFGLK